MLCCDRMAETMLDPAWRAVEEAWEQTQAHERFVSLCLSQGWLPEAAGRYRDVVDNDPGRAAIARDQMSKIITLVTHELQATRRIHDPSSCRARLAWMAFGLMLVLIGVSLVLLLRSGI